MEQLQTLQLQTLHINVITVGAYNTKYAYTTITGDIEVSDFNLLEIANFSSVGPRVDGIIKPDITAPGNHIALMY